MRFVIFISLFTSIAMAHSPVTPSPQGALRVQGNTLRDESGIVITLRGAQISGLEVPGNSPGAQNDAAMNDLTFGVVRQRWNMNAVRLPVSVAAWQRDGSRY